MSSSPDELTGTAALPGQRVKLRAVQPPQSDGSLAYSATGNWRVPPVASDLDGAGEKSRRRRADVSRPDIQ
jgi:hypothetical protein